MSEDGKTLLIKNKKPVEEDIRVLEADPHTVKKMREAFRQMEKRSKNMMKSRRLSHRRTAHSEANTMSQT